MALNIKDSETDRLARELAKATGGTITDTVRRGIEERLARVRAAATLQSHKDDLTELIARGRQRATLDDRPSDEIIGYDDRGLTR